MNVLVWRQQRRRLVRSTLIRTGIGWNLWLNWLFLSPDNFNIKKNKNKIKAGLNDPNHESWGGSGNRLLVSTHKINTEKCAEDILKRVKFFSVICRRWTCCFYYLLLLTFLTSSSIFMPFSLLLRWSDMTTTCFAA